jgi:hypothetical protein
MLKLARKISFRFRGSPFKEKDKIIKDQFGPSQPDQMYLPSTVNVKIIDSEEDIQSMVDSLNGSEFIGMDAEWLANTHKHAVIEPATFQLSSKENAFIIDLLALNKSTILRDGLQKVFSGENTTCLGFSFDNDMQVFRKSSCVLN